MNIKLPEVCIKDSKPFLTIVKERRTRRKVYNKLLSLQDISNICFIAAGETMPKIKKSKSRRTIASARNSQCVSLYVCLDTGIYLYDEVQHQLIQKSNQDVRHLLSTQQMFKESPFGLLYIADFSKLSLYTATSEARMMAVAACEMGHMSQNVYLYAALKEYHTTLIGLVKRDDIGELLKLKEQQYILCSQVVSYSS